MATTSLYSSTTQRTVTSRRGSRQIRHCSSSETLKQTEQNRTLALTSTRTSASRRTSAGSACSRWKAMRWAPFGPTPGSRPSSSMRSWTTPSYNSGPLEAELPRRRVAGQSAEAPGQRTEGVAGHRVRLGLRVAVRRHDHVAQHREVVGGAAGEAAGLEGDRESVA